MSFAGRDVDNMTIQGFQGPNIEFQAALKTTQISGNFHNFVKIPGYLKSYLNSIKLSKLTKFQAIASKDAGGPIYTILCL